MEFNSHSHQALQAMDKKVLKLLHGGDAAQLDQYLSNLSNDEKKELLKTTYTHGDSIAHFAAREQKLDVLKILARHNCPFEIPNDNGIDLRICV